MKLIITVICILLFLTEAAHSQKFSDVRSMSLGRTSASNSTDIDALNNNPANIYHERSVNDAGVYFSIGTNFNFLSNSEYLTFDFINKYFTENAILSPVILSDQDKADLVNDAGNQTVNLSGYLRSLAVVVNTKSIGSFGFSIDDRIAGDFRISRDFLDIGVYLPEINRVYDFSELKYNASWIRQLNFSYANKIHLGKKSLLKNLAFGVSIKPQFGLYYSETKSNNLTIQLDNKLNVLGNGALELLFSGITDFNELQFTLKPAGFGFGFDAGINGTFKELSKNSILNFGLSIIDLGYINWTKNTNNYYYNGNYIVTDITNQKQLDSLKEIIKGTRTPVLSFVKTLPTNLRLGLTYTIYKKPVSDKPGALNSEIVSLTGEYVQSFTENLSSTTKPVLGFGCEFNVGDVFYPRVGLAAGGLEKFVASFGFGIETGPVIIDLGTYNISSIFTPASTSKISGGLSIKFKI
ncbi:MAG: hypothetical protein HGGPFJEG_02743 [Ignavibacteria bacterium]|nr:hypothetical protein [Ignavibacteria bacterium]